MTRALAFLLALLAAGPTKEEVQALNHDLLTHDSATEVLTRWCADHHLADPPRIVAHRVNAGAPAASPQPRPPPRRAPTNPRASPHGALPCGAPPPPEPDTWSPPPRLPADMTRTREPPAPPSGAAAPPLGFHRRTLRAEVL